VYDNISLLVAFNLQQPCLYIVFHILKPRTKVSSSNKEGARELLPPADFRNGALGLFHPRPSLVWSLSSTETNVRSLRAPNSNAPARSYLFEQEGARSQFSSPALLVFIVKCFVQSLDVLSFNGITGGGERKLERRSDTRFEMQDLMFIWHCPCPLERTCLHAVQIWTARPRSTYPLLPEQEEARDQLTSADPYCRPPVFIPLLRHGPNSKRALQHLVPRTGIIVVPGIFFVPGDVILHVGASTAATSWLSLKQDKRAVPSPASVPHMVITVLRFIPCCVEVAQKGQGRVHAEGFRGSLVRLTLTNERSVPSVRRGDSVYDYGLRLGKLER
jgi:hypothetical protein